MPSTFSTNKNYELQATGEHINTWGPVLNQNFQLIDANFAGVFPVTITSADVTLTKSQAANLSYTVTGTLTGNRSLIFPTISGFYIINNGTSGAYSLTVKMASGAAVVVPQGEISFVYSNSTNMFAVSSTAAVVLDGAGAPTAAAPDGTLYYDTAAIQFYMREGGAWVAATPSYSTKTANTVLAGPTTGPAATPAYRALVSADIPASVALTGAPTAPTATADTNTTQIATTAYVVGQAGSATPNMDSTGAAGTSLRYARQDHTHPSDTSRAPLASPALTGTPTAPTATADTNTTQLATTAYVVGQAGSATPNMDSTGAVGTSLRYARQDHTHPSDTSRAPLASPALTGTPTAPTAAADTNTTQIATTAYVIGQAGSATPLALGTAAAGTSLRYSHQDHIHPAADLSTTTQVTGILAASHFPALTGDVTTTSGSLATTLANTAVTPGSYGSATQVGSFTVDAKGRLTAASSTSIQIAESQVTNLVTDLAGKQPLDATLTALAGVTTAADTVIYATGVDAFTTTTLTPFARTELAAINAAAQRKVEGAAKKSGANIPARDYATGTAWTARTSAADNGWRSLAWSPELGLFAAVSELGTGNRVMTSPDGITWTIRTSAADNSWTSITWSPELGLFAAAANSGIGNRVMTSPDGITWTIRTSAADNSWRGIAWSPELGLFAAVAYTGTGNRVMTSPDGITWTIRTSAADNNWQDIAWSPELGLFAAVSNSGTGNRVMTSPDGITWTIRTSAADNAWLGIAWSPELGLFAAVANTGTGNRVMTNGAFPGNLAYRRRNPRSAVLGDADATLSVGVSAVYNNVTATLTANRTITLAASYAVSGDTFSIKRSGLGAFTLSIVNGGPAGGTLRTGASATASAGVYIFDGTNWAEQSYVLL